MKEITVKVLKSSLIFLAFFCRQNFSLAGGESGTNRLVSGDSEICNIFLEYSNGKIDYENSPIIRFSNSLGDNQLITPPEDEYTALSLSSFDFNNDGILDQIFNLNGGGSYISGDILFVKFGEKYDLSDKKEFIVLDMNVFPCEFNKEIKTSNECEPFGKKSGGTGIAIEFPFLDKKINFHNRYTEVDPIGYNGKTYLLLNSTSSDSDLYNAVIETMPDKSYRPICLFKADPWHGN